MAVGLQGMDGAKAQDSATCAAGIAQQVRSLKIAVSPSMHVCMYDKEVSVLFLHACMHACMISILRSRYRARIYLSIFLSDLTTRKCMYVCMYEYVEATSLVRWLL